MPISIDFLANTGPFLRGAKDVEGAFEEVADALDDVVKDSRKAGDQLGDNVSDGAKEGERAVERLVERGFKDMADVARRESKSSGDYLDREIRRGTDGANEGLKDFKDESASTAKESAASFDGSADSIVDAFQEVAANAFVGFGPAGMIAGLAAAAGIGLMSAGLADGQEDAEAYKQQIADLGTEFIETGGIGKTSIEFIGDALKQLATNTDDSVQSLADLQKLAQNTGTDFEDIAQAYAGNTSGLDKLVDKQKDYLKLLQDEADSIDTTSSTSYGAALRKADDQQKIVDVLKQSQKAAEEAAAAEAAYNAAGGPEIAQKAEIIDGLASTIDDAAGSWEDFQSKESGAIDVGAYLANMQARIDTNNAYVDNLNVLKAQMTPEAFAQVIAGGPDLAPLIDSVVNASPEIQAQFAATYDAAAAQANGAIAGIQTDVPVTVTTTADVKPATLDLFRVKEDKSYVTTIGTKADTKPAEQQIKATADASHTSTITVKADTSAASNSIDALVNRARSVTIVAKVVDRNGTPVI